MNWIRNILITLILLAFAAAGFMLISNYYSNQSFAPWSMDNGLYIGSFSKRLIDPKSPKSAKVDLIVDASIKGYLIFISDLQGLRPVVLDLSVYKGKRAVDAKILLKNRKYRLEFSNPITSSLKLGSIRKYLGTVTDLNSGRAADWQVALVNMKPTKDSEVSVEEFKRWESYRYELLSVNESVKATERALEQSQREVVELTDLISNRDRLQEYSDEKLKSLREELIKLTDQQAVLRKEYDDLHSELQTEQQLSAQGRLISLAQDMRRREIEIINIKMKRNSSDTTEADSGLIAKGTQVKKLLDAIQEEQRIINNYQVIP